MIRCNYCNISICNYFKWKHIYICMNCLLHHNVYCITCEESKPVREYINNSILPTAECLECREIIKKKCIKCKNIRPLSLYTHRSNAKQCDICIRSSKIVMEESYKCVMCHNMREVKEFSNGTLRPCISCNDMNKLVLTKIIDIDEAEDSLTE
jgi:hypothetical protein